MGKVPVVNKDICIGCGACVAICPGVFQIGADGKSEITNPNGAGESEIQQAIDGCPVKAISWSE